MLIGFGMNDEHSDNKWNYLAIVTLALYNCDGDSVIYSNTVRTVLEVVIHA